VQVSSGGGNLAVWSPHKNELYYVGPAQTQVTVAPYSVSGQSFVPEKTTGVGGDAILSAATHECVWSGIRHSSDGERFAVAPLPDTANAAGRPGH
jgi:hypothetical protein